MIAVPGLVPAFVERLEIHPAPGHEFDRYELERALAPLRHEFPALIVAGPGPAPTGLRDVEVRTADWRDPEFDPDGVRELSLYAEPGRVAIVVVAEPGERPVEAVRIAQEVITRWQHLACRANGCWVNPWFEEALWAHRELHDMSKPLVVADYAHALDTWQWVLRLDPEANAALQLAALYHDVERLMSEADERVEHRADHYARYKNAHAEKGSRAAAPVLRRCGVDPLVVERTCDLIRRHERPGPDRDLCLLADADALSFFSLNAGGFVRYYGMEHARRKIAHALYRMTPRGRQRLDRVRQHPSVRDIVYAPVSHDPPPSQVPRPAPRPPRDRA